MKAAAGVLAVLTLTACGSAPIPRVGSISGAYRAELQPGSGPLREASLTVDERDNLVRVTLSDAGSERTFEGTSSLSRAYSVTLNATSGSGETCANSSLPEQSLELTFPTEGAPNGRLYRPTCRNGLPAEDFTSTLYVRLQRK